jgi:GT2 family glycosyltransferase
MAAETTVIIPNWNGAHRLARLLPQLAAQTLLPSRVIVVDNGSTDNSLQEAARFGAESIAFRENRGFAPAVNAGITASATDWVAILNNDVDLDPHWLERLIAAAESTGASYATGKTLQLSSPELLDGCFDLLSRSGLAWRAGYGCPAAQYSEPMRIRCAPFTALILRRGLFASVGPLDERFGSYLEDVDFGLRCALSGAWGVYEPSAIARHEGSATLGKWSAQMVELLSRNQLLLIAKHFPESWFSTLGMPVIAGHVLWGLLALRRGRFRAWLRGKRTAMASWGEWRRQAEATPLADLERLLLDDENFIRRLQHEGSRETFWSLYFRFVGERH